MPEEKPQPEPIKTPDPIRDVETPPEETPDFNKLKGRTPTEEPPKEEFDKSMGNIYPRGVLP
jgi:hypothetical protein